MKIIVATYTKNAHLLSTFFECFDRVWPDCPYEIYVLYNAELRPRQVVEMYGVPARFPDYGWPDNVLRWLDDEQNEPFLLMLDDYFLVYVDRDLVKMAETAINDPSTGCIRLVPGPNLLDTSGDFSLIAKDKPYSLSLQASMWKPQMLRDLLRKGESIWGVEHQGSKRVAVYERYNVVGVTRSALAYQNYLRRGNPQEKVIEWLQEEGICLP
jgi:hypothetical protein